MTQPENHMTSRAFPFGKGFDFVMASPDCRPFRAWWNTHSFFPVSEAEANTMFSQPEYRDAA